MSVYEEVSEPEHSRSAKRRGLKTRFLSQVVSAGSPTYLYDLCLGKGDVDFKPGRCACRAEFARRAEGSLYRGARCRWFSLAVALNACSSRSWTPLVLPPSRRRPYAAVSYSAAEGGYALAVASVEAREVEVLERLTPEALRSRIAAESPVEPIYLAPGTAARDLPWATGDVQTSPFPPAALSRNGRRASPEARNGGSVGKAHGLASQLLGCLSNHLAMDTSEFRTSDRANAAAKTSAAAILESSSSSASSAPTAPADFMPLARPLYVTAAAQVGLMGDPKVPSLPDSLLGASGVAGTTAASRLLRRWLLAPPPPAVADARSQVLDLLGNGENAAKCWLRDTLL